MLSFAEFSGALLSLFFLKYLKLKLSFVVGFCISLVGGLLVLMMGSSNVQLMPIFLLVAKFGISINFNLSYICTATLFPTLFVGAAFGITNFFSRFFTIFSPLVSEVPDPIPMLIFCFSTALAIVASCFIQTGTKQVN